MMDEAYLNALKASCIDPLLSVEQRKAAAELLSAVQTKARAYGPGASGQVANEKLSRRRLSLPKCPTCGNSVRVEGYKPEDGPCYRCEHCPKCKGGDEERDELCDACIMLKKADGSAKYELCLNCLRLPLMGGYCVPCYESEHGTGVGHANKFKDTIVPVGMVELQRTVVIPDPGTAPPAALVARFGG